MVYSEKLRGVLCEYCTLFAVPTEPTHLGVFVRTPVDRWEKLHEKAQTHASNKYHNFAMERAEDFLKVRRDQVRSVVAMMDKRVAEKRKVVLAGVQSICKALLLCGKQGIALREHDDDRVVDPDTDYFGEGIMKLGNFNAPLLLQSSSGDANLIKHLKVMLIFCLN